MKILVLGPIEAVDEHGRPIAIGGPIPRMLLAALATDPERAVASDRLVEILWPERVPDNAVGALQTAVSRLRSALGASAIRTADQGYALAADLDRTVFERLLLRARSEDPATAVTTIDDAIALWRGPMFGTWRDLWWAKPAADRLDALRLAALSDRIDALLALGRHEVAVAETELMVADDPLREGTVRRRMVALHLSGRSAEALRVAASFRSRLAAQTGLDPSPALAEMERMILEHDDSSLLGPARTLRGYQLGELIAEGSFGAVYHAVQTALARDVAVKVVRRERADDPDFVRRFEAEARLVARLEHPSIVPLYDYWREPGGAFLVFRLLRGGSLEQLLERGDAVSIADIDLVVDRVGSALMTAHRAGVVHHDVRAANVLLDELGHPYLADFGIAVEDTSIGASPVDDVVGLAQIVARLLSRVSDVDDAAVEPVRSVLRRATMGEIATVRDLIAEWRLTRGSVDSATASPDGPPRRRVERGDRDASANPYKGLRSFTEPERNEFFGRDHVAEQLLAAIESHPFVAVVGPSGSGKSSLAHAAVVPAARERGHLVASMTPGARPMAALAHALRGVATEAQAQRGAGDVAALLRTIAADASTLLLIDQFEELWTVADPGERDDLLTTLLDVVDQADAGLRIMVTLRADFFDRPLADARLGERLRTATFPIVPLTAAELEEVVVRPLEGRRVSVEPALVATLIADVLRQPGALPLLQFALATLFERRTGDVLSLEAYRQLGGVSGAIASQAEQLYRELSREAQDESRALFEELVTVGDAGNDARRRVRRSDLIGVSAAVIDQFDRARLLTFDRDPATGEPTVEIAHEALLTHWPRLSGWIDANRETLVARRLLRDDAAVWAAVGREPSHLYRGVRLEMAIEALERTPLTAHERAFVDASNEARAIEVRRDGRRLRRTRMLLAATAGLLAVALFVGGLALRQRTRAEEQADVARASATAAAESEQRARTNTDDARDARVVAELRRVAADARTLAVTQPDLGMLLAVEAVDRNPGTESESALLSTLQANPVIDRVIDLGLAPGETITAVSGRPPGRLLVSTQTQVLVVDGASLRPTGVRWDIDAPGASAVSADGRTGASISGRGTVERRDLTTGAAVGPQLRIVPDASILTVGVAFAADGSLALSAGRTLHVYQAGAAVAVRSIDYDAPIGVLTGAPDGRQILVSASAFGSPAGRTELVDPTTGARTPVSDRGVLAATFDGRGSLYLASFVPAVGNHLEVRELASGAVRVVRDLPGTVGFRSMIPLDADRLLYSLATLQLGTVDAALAELVPLTAAAPTFPWVALDGGRVLGSLGARLVVLDPTATALPVDTLALSGTVYPKRVADRVLVSNADGARLYDARTFQPIGPVISGLASLVFGRGDLSPDGRLAAGQAFDELRLFQAETGVLLGSVRGTFDGGVPHFSPRGDRLAAKTKAGITIYDVPSLTPRREYPLDGVFALDLMWSPDGTELLVIDTVQAPGRIELDDGRTTVLDGMWAAFADDDSSIVAVGVVAPLRVFDRADGRTSALFTGFQEPGAVQFVPGARRVFRSTTAGYFDIVDLATGTRVGEPFALASSEEILPMTVSFAADGSSVLLGRSGAAVQRIELDPARWREIACAAAGRNLTQAEWAQHFGPIGAPYRPTCAQYPTGP